MQISLNNRKISFCLFLSEPHLRAPNSFQQRAVGCTPHLPGTSLQWSPNQPGLSPRGQTCCPPKWNLCLARNCTLGFNAHFISLIWVLSFQKWGLCRHPQLCWKQFGFTRAVFVLSFVSSLKVSSGLGKYTQSIKRWQLFKSSSCQMTFVQHRINSLAVPDARSWFGVFCSDVFFEPRVILPRWAPGLGQRAGVPICFSVVPIPLPGWCPWYLQCARAHHSSKGSSRCLSPLQNTSKSHLNPGNKHNKTAKPPVIALKCVSEKKTGISFKVWGSQQVTVKNGVVPNK